MLLFSLALLALPQGQVHVVDAAGGPGSDYTQLFRAVQAASDGDVVLVRAGDYFSTGIGIYLAGKGLTVVAEPGDVVRTRSVRVQDLPAASRVLVQGLVFTGGDEVDAELQANLGPLWFERCAFEPGPCCEWQHAMRTTDCDAVVLARSTLEAFGNDFFPSSALFVQDSRLHLFDSSLQGVPSFADFDFLAAVVLREASFLELFGSTVHGGDGYDGVGGFFDCDGFAGGDAVSLENASTLVTLDSALVGGVGGDPFTSSCAPGADGEEIVLVSGTVEHLAGTARSLEISSPVRSGEPVQATMTGLPGDRVFVRYSFAPGTGFSSRFYDGENLLGPQRFRAFTVTLPASGVQVVTAPAPQLQPGQESLVAFCQAFFVDAAGQRIVASSPSALVVLDASF